MSWSPSTPAAQGVDPDALVAALQTLERRAGREGVRKTVIARHGHVIHRGDRAHDVQRLWSITKTMMSTAAGVVFDRGIFTLDTTAAAFVPELRERYAGVTIGHLLTMSSGYAAQNEEPIGDYAHGPSRAPWRMGEPRFAPGERFEYWDSSANLLGKVLTIAAGGEPLDELFRRSIAEPIGMDPGRWSWGKLPDDDGRAFVCGAGNHEAFRASADEVARLGQLFLNGGTWAGRRVLSQEWVDLATRPHVKPGRHPGGYGLMWWTNRGPSGDEPLAWPSAPPGTFSATGYNNNDLFVIPEWDAVVVRLGLDQEDREITNVDYDTFLAALGRGIEGEDGE